MLTGKRTTWPCLLCTCSIASWVSDSNSRALSSNLSNKGQLAQCTYLLGLPRLEIWSLFCILDVYHVLLSMSFHIITIYYSIILLTSKLCFYMDSYPDLCHTWHIFFFLVHLLSKFNLVMFGLYIVLMSAIIWVLKYISIAVLKGNTHWHDMVHAKTAPNVFLFKPTTIGVLATSTLQKNSIKSQSPPGSVHPSYWTLAAFSVYIACLVFNTGVKWCVSNDTILHVVCVALQIAKGRLQHKI